MASGFMLGFGFQLWHRFVTLYCSNYFSLYRTSYLHKFTNEINKIKYASVTYFKY